MEKMLGTLTFPFISVLLSFLVIALIIVFLGWKIDHSKGVLVKSRWVVFVEMFFNFFSNIVSETVGDKYIKNLTPLTVTMWMTIFIGNAAVLFGFQEAATDIMFPLTWTILMFVFWNGYGIYKIGIGNFIKDFFKPMWWLFPLEIIGFITKPLTLLVRMFGNITSGFIMMGIIFSLPQMLSGVSDVLGIGSLIILVPLGGALSFYFDVFAPFIQATVFTYLVLVNLGMLINEEE